MLIPLHSRIRPQNSQPNLSGHVSSLSMVQQLPESRAHRTEIIDEVGNLIDD